METMDTTVRARIAEAALRLFLRYGIRGITMDTIAQKLHISKRTIYEHYDDKEELVSVCVGRFLDASRRERQQVHESASNVIEGLVRAMNLSLKQVQQINPAFMLDIERYYPAVSAQIQQFRGEKLYQDVVAMIEEGIQEGFFLEEIDIDIVVKLFLAQIDVLTDPDVFPPEQYERADLIRHVIINFIRGIATERGRKYIQTYVDGNNA